MNNWIVIVLFCLFGVDSLAQSAYYAVHFTDKKGSESLSVEDCLSPRAVARRVKHKIPFTPEDLPIPAHYIQQVEVIAEQGNTCVLKWENKIAIILDSPRKVSDISSLPFVSRVEYIGAYNRSNSRSEQEKFALESSYTPDYAESWTQNGMIGVSLLHKDGFTGEGMLIAVFDAGFRHMDTLPLFESMWTNGRIKGQKDFVNHRDSVFYSSNHGMSVTSTIGVDFPGRMVGSAPRADYFLIMTEDATQESIIEEYYWAEAAEYADSIGADIINSSLGYTRFDNPEEDHTYEDMDGNTTPVTRAANKAYEKGILVVNSAGNSGSGDWFYIGAPADGYGVLSIGAVGRNQEIAAFSSRGPNYSGQVKPDVSALGWGTSVAAPGGGIWQSSGTSFSSPIMAGAAACLWQAYPEMNNQTLMEVLRECSHLYETPNEEYGYGIPNLQKALEILENRRFPQAGNPALYQNFLLYPNPSPGQSRVEFVIGQSSANVELRILDLMGRTVKQSSWRAQIGHNYIDLNLDGVTSGAYIVEFTIDGVRKTEKFVVQSRRR